MLFEDTRGTNIHQISKLIPRELLQALHVFAKQQQQQQQRQQKRQQHLFVTHTTEKRQKRNNVGS